MLKPFTATRSLSCCNITVKKTRERERVRERERGGGYDKIVSKYLTSVKIHVTSTLDTLLSCEC